MIEPSINKLMKNIDSRYTLVVIAAKRARRLTEGEPRMVSYDSEKSVSIAIREIAEGKISYSRDKEL